MAVESGWNGGDRCSWTQLLCDWWKSFGREV